MLKAGIIGLGKMGISHCAIVNAHPKARVYAVCDTSRLILEGFKKYSGIETYTDYKRMLDDTALDCVYIASPTKFHAEMALYALGKNVHTFCEKPFVLNSADGEMVINLARNNSLVNQVGYHNRFIATFCKAKALLDHSVIGPVYHFVAESYGPVITRTKGGTWRAKKEEGGGCLYDYASHVIDLTNYLIGPPNNVRGTILKRVYSHAVEDCVYSIFNYEGKITGILSVNWSDESYRKMTIQMTIWGTRGKIIVDAQGIKVFLKDDCLSENMKKG
jgi:predicted dehydrogenase